jgi:hypothetical protein
MNIEETALAEMYIATTIRTMKDSMEKGVPHDEIIRRYKKSIMESVEECSNPENASDYLGTILSRTMYHLANMQTNSTN